ncbi:MAG: hypothetical protein IPK06_09880 [Ignavibacteriae bacterium]|nr:hypothetical protein [Ignavibacteriota bacterium]
MKKIKITDGGELLTFDLVDILNCIKDVGSNYNWAILDIYLTSKNNSNLNVLEFENEVNAKNELFKINFIDMLNLSSKFNQVIDGKFIAFKGNFNNELIEIKDLEEKFDVVIEAIDSSYWTVFSKDELIIELLKSTFRKVEILK